MYHKKQTWPHEAQQNQITKGMGLYIHIPPCPPEGVAVSEDEERAVGTCPERGGVEISWSHVHKYT